MAAIELRHVSKFYGAGPAAVADASLEIRDGEFMILLGPSGCGKSTTLRMIAGLESVSSGEVRIGGKRVNELAPRDRNIAVVFQSYALYPHMTVGENLAFGLKMHKLAKAEIEKRVSEVAAMLGIAPFLGRKPAALSGGQRQRVALGRALVREPAAFLLDEPLSNLDARLRADMRLELVKLHRQLGATIVHVTHDQIEAMTMGERICIMKDGRIVQVGEPLEVYRNPANTFVAGFLASPPMNLIDGRLAADSSGSLRLEAAGVTLILPPVIARGYQSHAGKAVILGFRPEDVHEEPVQPTWLAIEGSVVALEALGAEVILVLGLGGPPAVEISAKLGRDYRAPIGSRQRLYLDSAEIRLFDPQTTNALPRLAEPSRTTGEKPAMLKETFGAEKPIIAMVHFPPLPGSPQYDAKRGVQWLVDSCAADIENLQAGGVDAVMFGNEGDRPYLMKATPETVAAMAAAIATLKPMITRPFGVDYLWDPSATVALGVATGAAFGREVMTGVYDSDMGLWQPDAASALRLRHNLARDDFKLLYNVTAEFASPVGTRSIAQRARSAVFSALADVVVVSGPMTGEGVDTSDLKAAKAAVKDTPVFANTGVNIDTVKGILDVADGCVIGTHFKREGITWNPVDGDRVKRFMDLVRRLR